MKIKFIFPLFISFIFISCKMTKVTAHSTETESQSEVQKFDERLLGKWTLDYIMPKDGKDLKQLYKIQKPYLNFVDETKVAGNNGCNNVSGGFSFGEGNFIQFHTEKFGSTRMFCEGVDEKVFLDGLKAVNKFDITDEGKKLVFITGDIVTMSFLKESK